MNSWGVHWGEKGLFRIRRGTNECQIEDEIAAGTPSSLPSLSSPDAASVSRIEKTEVVDEVRVEAKGVQQWWQLQRWRQQRGIVV